MPTYVYVILSKDGSEGETFEVVQKMSDPPLTKHPETGRPVRRLILAPNINTKGSGKRYLDPGYQAKHGFTRYEKTGDGTYQKTAGKGPDVLKRD